jgi:hypothetical protein
VLLDQEEKVYVFDSLTQTTHAMRMLHQLLTANN